MERSEITEIRAFGLVRSIFNSRLYQQKAQIINNLVISRNMYVEMYFYHHVSRLYPENDKVSLRLLKKIRTNEINTT